MAGPWGWGWADAKLGCQSTGWAWVSGPLAGQGCGGAGDWHPATSLGQGLMDLGWDEMGSWAMGKGEDSHRGGTDQGHYSLLVPSGLWQGEGEKSFLEKGKYFQPDQFQLLILHVKGTCEKLRALLVATVMNSSYHDMKRVMVEVSGASGWGILFGSIFCPNHQGFVLPHIGHCTEKHGLFPVAQRSIGASHVAGKSIQSKIWSQWV